MARGNPPVEVRIDPETRARWQAEADRLGVSLSSFVRDAVDAVCAVNANPEAAFTGIARGPFVTKSGKVLTDADIQKLADEAEREHVADVGVIMISGGGGGKRTHQPDFKKTKEKR